MAGRVFDGGGLVDVGSRNSSACECLAKPRVEPGWEFGVSGGGWRQAAAGLTALCLALAGTAGPAGAQDAPPQDAPPRQALTIGYVEIAGDARYEPVKAGDRIILKTRAHPYVLPR